MSEIPRPISPEKFDEIVQTVNVESGTGDGGLADDSLQDLVEKVVHGFVTCLQKDSVDIWQSFNEILEIIQPYSILIQENAQLTHYARRAYNHVFVNPNCGLDVKALSLAFPKEIAELRKDESTNNRKIKFPAGSPHQSEVDLQFKRVNEKKGISILKRAVIPSSGIYNDDIERAKYVLPRKELHIGDLRKSLPFVVHEIGLREASWGRPLGMTAVALNVDLAEMLPATSRKDSGSYLTEDFLADSLKLAQDNKTSLVEKAERRPLTGQEVVEKFIKGHFLGMTKFAYLNQVQSKYYNPYNLVVVPRKKREPEHYVMSPHAILHVIPNGPSELQPLVEWYKEAILFTALLKFSFFKNFLAAKMFQKWKRMKKMSQFRALCDHIAQAMVLCIPSFGSALLRIFSLIQDMDQVQFLPLDDLRCKPLQEFNSITVKLLEDAQECLKMFFTYCLSVINKTRENCFDYLEYCKEQLERKSGNPKGSLSLAKERKAIKEQNLKLAKHEIYQLGKFFKLVEHILAAKLLTLARYNIGTFVNKVLGGEEIKELGYISISLEFDKRDKLVLVPTPDRLQGSLFYAIESVLKILCHSSESLDSEFCDSGGDRNHSDDSPTSLSRYVNCMGAYAKSSISFQYR